MTLFETATILSLLVVGSATFVRSTFGFGEALIAMPLLSLTVGIDIAQPLVALLSVCIAGTILIRDWRDVHLGSAGRLVLSSLIGVPLGLFGYRFVSEFTVKLVLGLVIIFFAVYRLARPARWKLKTERGAVAFGFLGGVLGGAYNVTGPPLVIYGTLRHWSAHHFRATLQSVFLPTSILIAVLHGASGSVTRDVWFLWLACLPVVLCSIAAGRWLNQRIDGRQFANAIYYLLIVIGAALIWRTWTAAAAAA